MMGSTPHQSQPFVDHPECGSAAFVPPVTIKRAGNYVVMAWTNDYARSVVWEQSVDLTSGWLGADQCAGADHDDHMDVDGAPGQRTSVLPDAVGLKSTIQSQWRALPVPNAVDPQPAAGAEGYQLPLLVQLAGVLLSCFGSELDVN
jgi:hypothetical protein